MQKINILKERFIESIDTLTIKEINNAISIFEELVDVNFKK